GHGNARVGARRRRGTSRSMARAEREAGMDRERLLGNRMLAREAQLPTTRMKEMLQLNLEHGLESAASVRDRTIPLFNRTGLRFHHATTFAGRPFLRDMRELGGQDVAVVGAPFDGGTTYRPGARFGPQGI